MRLPSRQAPGKLALGAGWRASGNAMGNARPQVCTGVRRRACEGTVRHQGSTQGRGLGDIARIVTGVGRTGAHSKGGLHGGMHFASR